MNKKRVWDYVSAPAPRYMLRLAVLEELFRKEISHEIKTFLEIGPGFGDISNYLMEQFVFKSGAAVDFSDGVIELLSERMKHFENFKVYQTDITKQPLSDSIDSILMFEVLEHIDDDVDFLKSLYNMLSEGGLLFLSVPAYMKKWQNQDEYAGHVRRYEKDELITKLESTGFSINQFLCYGFPLIDLIRPLKQIYYKPKYHQNKQELTADSGIKNRLHVGRSTLINYLLLYPFIQMQRLFLRTRFGDGFIVVCKKVEGAI